MPFLVDYLHSRVVCVLVADEERSLGRAAVGVDPLVAEDGRVDLHVLLRHGAVERERHHLRRLAELGLLAGNAGAVGGAEAVGEEAGGPWG